MNKFYELPAESTAVSVETLKLRAGIGWDVKEGTLAEKVIGAAEELFSGASNKAYDLNISAIVRHQDGSEELVFYGNASDESEALHYLRDNRTGSKDGEDEAITINLEKLPETVKEIVLFALIYNGAHDKKNFSMIKNFFIQITDAAVEKVLFRNDTAAYEEEPSKHSVYVFAKLKKDGEAWKILPKYRFSDENNEQDLQEAIK